VLGDGATETLLDALWRVDVLDDVGALPLAPAGTLARAVAGGRS
jgi:hypothetical protein